MSPKRSVTYVSERTINQLQFCKSKPFVPFNAAALPPWAGIVMLARVAVIRPSPATRVAIATAPSVRHKRANAGWRLGNGNCSTPAISTWSSPYLTSLMSWLLENPRLFTEFLRRFFLHLLPKSFVRIRHFGFLANCFRASRLELTDSCWLPIAQ